jgi:ornithine cyclodeaminase/alanine dehydrogenase-like protein (mu-crystallin family)
MKTFDAPTTARALPFKPLIEAIEQMFVAGCEVPLRHSHQLNDAASILIMPAWQRDGYLGIKTVTIVPGKSARGLPGLLSTYQLFDSQTGEAVAAIDGNEITSRRTAAASALAASRLARADAKTMLLVGTGRVGSLLPEAYRTVLPIQRVLVWDIKPEAASAFTQKLIGQEIDAVVVTDLEAATRQADIVSCATLSTAPLIQGAWLQRGSHLDLIGSFKPEMRETDDACFAHAELWVDTEEALIKSGDLLSPLKSGVITQASVRGTLTDLCRNKPAARDRAARTVFKAVGTALEDLAAAILVLESSDQL